MDFGSVIQQAWLLTRRYRFLWVLALFAGSPLGTCGSPPTGGGFPSGDGSFDSADGSAEASEGSSDFTAWLGDHLGIVLLVIGVIALIALAFLMLWLVAQGGMAQASSDLVRGRPTSLGQAWRAGLRLFWRYAGLVGIQFLAVIAAGLLIGALAGVAYVTGGTGAAVGAGIAAGALFAVLIGIPATIVIAFAQRAIVVDGAGPIAAVSRGIALLRRRLGASLLTWLVSVALGIGAGIGFIVALVIAAIPLAIIGVIIFVVAPGPLLVAYIILAVLAALAAILVGAAALNTFFWHFWTVAYLELRRPRRVTA